MGTLKINIFRLYTLVRCSAFLGLALTQIIFLPSSHGQESTQATEATTARRESTRRAPERRSSQDTMQPAESGGSGGREDATSWERDLGLWVQADSHASDDADTRAVIEALGQANPRSFLNEDMSTHVERCRQGRRSGASAAFALYSRCHCGSAARGFSDAATCGPIVLRQLQERFHLPTSAVTQSMSSIYRDELRTLVFIPRSRRRAAHMGSAQARLIEDCSGHHLQVVTPRLSRDGTVPPAFLAQLRQHFENAAIAATTRVTGLRGDAGPPHIASVCDVTRPGRSASGVFVLDANQGVVVYGGDTSAIASAGYMDLSCLPTAEGQRQARQAAARAEERRQMDQGCEQMRASAATYRRYISACADIFNTSSGTTMHGFGPMPTMEGECADAYSAYMSSLRTPTLDDFDFRSEDSYRLYADRQRRQSQYCASTARSEEERLWHLFAERMYQPMLQTQEERTTATEQYNSLVNRAASWCASNFCQCRGSSLTMYLMSAVTSETDDSAIVSQLRAAEERLEQQYTGRPTALRQDCPGTFSVSTLRQHFSGGGYWGGGFGNIGTDSGSSGNGFSGGFCTDCPPPSSRTNGSSGFWY